MGTSERRFVMNRKRRIAIALVLLLVAPFIVMATPPLRHAVPQPWQDQLMVSTMSALGILKSFNVTVNSVDETGGIRFIQEFRKGNVTFTVQEYGDGPEIPLTALLVYNNGGYDEYAISDNYLNITLPIEDVCDTDGPVLRGELLLENAAGEQFPMVGPANPEEGITFEPLPPSPTPF